MQKQQVIGLIDLDSVYVLTLQTWLKNEGFNTLHLSLEQYRASAQFYDFHLVIMPFRPNSTSIHDIKQSVNHSHQDLCCSPPKVIVILDNNQDLKELVYLQGADDYISYPLIYAELQVRLRTLIQGPQSAIGTAVIKEALETNKTSEVTSNPIQAHKISQYLLDNLDKNIQLNQLARKMGLNRNKLSRVFSDYYGMTIFSWLRKQRMSLAAELLVSTQKSMSQIAIQVGYKDSNHFSTQFKKRFGFSPTHHRKKYQSVKNQEIGA